MHAMILGRPDFHAAAPELFKATRRGQFPQAFAQLYEDVGLHEDEYVAIGSEFESAMRMKDGPAKDKRLCRLAVWVARLLGLNGRVSDDPRRQALVNDIFELARRHNGTRPWEAPPHVILVGYAVGAAEHAVASGLPLDPHGLAETVHAAVVAEGLPFSPTDVRDTVRAMTTHRPLTDWMLPEEVERLRPLMHERLIQFLRSPDCIEWLRDVERVPEWADWLIGEMETPEEFALLRARAAELKEERALGALN